MTDGRNLIILLTEEQSSYEAVRAAFGVWNDVLYALSDGAYSLHRLGEERQAEAMMIDAESMARRARLHIRNMTARHKLAAELEGEPEDTGVISDANNAVQQQHAANGGQQS